MVDVIAWPPVSAVGTEPPTLQQPVSRSVSLFTGKRYISAALSARRVATVHVAGIGLYGAGAGYVEMLKRELDGGINLVRLSLCSPVYQGGVRGLARQRGVRSFNMVTGEYDVDVTSGGNPLSFIVGRAISATADTIEGHPVLRCTGLPASRRIAWPSETVRVTDALEATHTARVLRVATSNAAGAAVIYLDAALPDGDALIGFRESVVYEVLDPDGIRSVQPISGKFSYTFELSEVFEAETDGFVEVNPWR